jgi:hypothetical protein
VEWPSVSDAGIRGEMQKPKPAKPGGPPKGDQEAIKRLTVDLPESLHRRVKVACAERGLIMAEVIRELLERKFPK